MEKKTLIIHLLLGIALLGIPIVSSPDYNKGWLLFTVAPFLRNFFSYFLLVVFLFLHYYVIVPKFYLQKKWVLYGLLILACGFAVSYLPILVVDLGVDHIRPNMQIKHLQRPRGFLSVFNVTNALIFQFFMVWILSLLLRLENRLAEVKNEKLLSEVSYLKAQINPHFLFNTLNNIYSLTLTNSNKAPRAVLKLADMMRYIVTESSTDKVDLKKELQYIENYVELQKLRMGNQVDLQFQISGNCEGKEIGPIILITYIENAFKYGVSPEVPTKIDISITIKKNKIELFVKNDIVSVEEINKSATKEGLSNTQKRLDILYRNKYKLDIGEVQGKWEVNLLIDIA
ncbi:sensor histidine kinase [Algibacter sp. L3A6]|uniref:sensor histidine kinase n=1 Tax=Algibacter sp. L3A6 TaxID=2686366 RepID=UPI00131B8C23|nr:sensor histidine kinase [Algibacter sp. L3A6]